MLKTDIQMFAVQTTQMSTEQNNLSSEMKTYYEKRLISLASPELIFDQFADKYNIPAGNGKSIEFRKFTPLVADLSATTLTEGVTPDGNKLDVQTVTSEVTQFGDYIEVSDMLDLTAIDPIIVQATALSGSQAGRVLNKVTREVISAGTNVRYAPKVGEDNSLTAVEMRSDLDKSCKLTPSLIRKAAGDLKRHNAPKFDGSYVCIVHPDVATELMADKEWIEAHKYESSANIFDGEIGKLAGVRFIENTQAKIWKDSTCPILSYKVTNDNAPVSGKTYYTKNSDTYTVFDGKSFSSATAYYEADEILAVYACYFIGKNAYGTTQVDGGGLEHIIKPLGAGNDPLNQRATIGWKATKTAEILVDEYMVRVECCTDDSDIAEAN